MPVNLVPVDVFAANFQAAADGDPVSQATSVNILQEVADALTYLRNRAQYGTMNVALGQPVLQTGGVFNFDSGVGTTGHRWRTLTNGVGAIRWIPQLPPLGRITGINVVSEGAGHGGVVAAVLATVQFFRIRQGVALTLLVTETDNGNAGTIDTVHSWAVTAINEPIDPLAHYLVVFNNENGANSQANTTIQRIALSIALPT